MIVVEGMDNTGKSTLARRLAQEFGLFIQESEGPPRATPEMTAAYEINERIRRYKQMDDTLFVRHPCISNNIYSSVREEGDPVFPDYRERFYTERHILIYCDPNLGRRLDDHVVKLHDTEKHLRDIASNYDKLLGLYRLWAVGHAHFVYRIGDDTDRLVAAVRAAIHHDRSNV